ncbi:MAG: hypothetical protein QXJ93_01220 [Candidatus Rehaiarchaeum fermentans]|nr:hypothetical protein [Candidatus Rehaiarchaeum fermentans]
MNAEEKYKITVLCSKCSKPMTVLPDDDMHDAIKKQMQNWYHVECAKK